MIGHHKRHAYKIKTKWGATKQGKIIAVEADIISDAGAYMYTSNKVLANSTLMITGPYHVPNAKCGFAKSVCTNTVPGGAFRGFGGPQSCFATEMQMDKLAEALDMDPVEVPPIEYFERRMKNCQSAHRCPKASAIDKVHQVMRGSRRLERRRRQVENAQVRKVKGEKGKDQGEILHGIGIAAGYKNIGFSFGANETCWAGITISGNGEY